MKLAENAGHALAIAMATVWLVFLYFPLNLALTGDVPTAARIATVALTAVFVVVYVTSAVVGFRGDGPTQPTVTGWAIGVTLTLTAIGMTEYALIGVQAATYFIYIVAITIFLYPPRIGLSVSALYVVVTYTLMFLSRDGIDIAAATIVVGVYVACAGSVYFEHVGTREGKQRAAAAVLDERERVARDVHDVLGHSLTVIALKSDLAARLAQADPSKAREEMIAVAALARTGISELRTTIMGLKVRQLAEELEQAREVTAGAGVALEVTGTPQDVDPRHRITFAWALREAVTNVLRHSGASAMSLTFESDTFVVTDNGTGFGGRMGNGLRGLAERVGAAGGTLSIEPTGNGTTLEVTM